MIIRATQLTLITAWLPCVLVLLAKLATSHVLQGNKIKTYRGRGKRLSLSIELYITRILHFEQGSIVVYNFRSFMRPTTGT